MLFCFVSLAPCLQTQKTRPFFRWVFLHRMNLKKITAFGTELNLDWVRRHPEHELTKENKRPRHLFTDDRDEGYETSCEITAHAICEVLGMKKLVPCHGSIKNLLINAIENKHVLRVEMGSFQVEWAPNVPDHVIITDGRLMFDSFYEHRAITCRKVNIACFINNDFPALCYADVTKEESADWTFRIFRLE